MLKNIAASKMAKLYLCMALSCLLVLAACDNADSAQAETDPVKIVQASVAPSKSGEKMGTAKSAPMFDGDVVADSNGAIWWVGRLMAFVVNEKAARLSPLLDQAPPSITEDAAKQAFAGTLPPMPANLEIPYAYTQELMRVVYEQHGIVPEHPEYLLWLVHDGDIQKGALRMEEFGGMITKVTINATFLKDAGQPEALLEAFNSTSVKVLFTGMDISLKSNEEVKEVMDRCFAPLLTAAEGTMKATVKHGKRLTFTRLPSDEEDKIKLSFVIEPRVKQ
ncbi:hypothetical protein LJB93_01820 [Desulfovibrio sp. OttesenSCG-928-F07]|nr:hypothetical protein [Desulfovibrio sp. OttesenSCG-928-F07]